MQRRFPVWTVGMIFVITLVVLAGGCEKRGHIITVGPTGLDPHAKPPTIRSTSDVMSSEAGEGESGNTEGITERTPTESPGEFDCDAETATLEAQLALAREQDARLEEEFFDVLAELSAAQSSMEEGNTSATLDRYARAQAAYEEMNERVEESRETVKSLKLALKLARERCEGASSEVIPPEETASEPASPEQSCGEIDAIIGDIEDLHEEIIDLQQDYLDELDDHYELDDDLDEAQASGEGTDAVQSDIDEKDDAISSLSDEIADRKDDLSDLRQGLIREKDSCTLPRDITSVCTLSRATIEGTIQDLGDEIQEIEDRIGDLREDRRSAIEEGDVDARGEAQEELASVRSDLRDKQEELFEEEGSLAAHEAFC